MRHLPKEARIAIATLYGRYRDQRRRSAEIRAVLGNDHSATRSLSDQMAATRNALQAVIVNIDHPPHYPNAKELLRHTALKARLNKKG